MAPSDIENSDSSNDLLGQVVADYVRAIEDGNPPGRDELLAEHPDLGDELRDFFRHRDRMEALLDPLRSAAQRVLNVRCPHCHNAIELVDHAQVTDLNCPSCGSNFSLVNTTSAGGPLGLKRIGQFQLLEQVGVGQFGTVWKARDLTLERFVAIKIPRSRQLNQTEAELFLRDARVAAQLKHPNIVGVHEVGKHDDMIYIVSDFIHGASLKEWAVVKPPAQREAAALCATVAKALHYAHESGVVHRDIKPGNIMMDVQAQPRIVDFGLAKRESGEITMTVEGQILGTPAYMSPEQARGDAHHVDRKADIYSLGVILFELLTGELPFRGDKQMLLVQILKDAAPSPRKLNITVPRDLETICLKCLEKEPLKRYATAQLLADDCQRYLQGKPVLARPVSGLARGWRWCRRSPLVATLSGAVVALLVGIAVVAAAGYMRTQAALTIANERAETIERNLYYSEMNRAGAAAMNAEGLAQVWGLLEKWRTTETRVDRRGWEWDYLNSLLHQDLVTLNGHQGGAFSVAWSPDGSLLASGSADGTVRIWASDGHIVHTLQGHRAQVNSLGWNSQGTLIASASYDGAVKIWDANRGKVLNTLLHDGPVDAAAWSRDDQRLAVANFSDSKAAKRKPTVTIWTASLWEKEHEFRPTPTRIRNLCWNPDGSQIAIGSRTGAIVCDPSTGKITLSFEGEGGSVAWSYDGTRLAAGDANRMQVWDVASQERVVTFNANVAGSTAWSPDGSVLGYKSGQKTVELSDVTTKTQRLRLRGHLSRITNFCWHPSGQRIATGSVDGTVKVWSTTNKLHLSAGSRAISWNPDGSQYVSRDRKSVLICNPQDSRAVKRIGGHAAEVFTVSWSPNGKSIASASLDGEIRVWDVASGEARWSQKSLVPDLRHRSPLPTVLAWSPDSRRLAFPQADHAIGIVDANTGERIYELKGHTDGLRTLAWSPDGARLVSGAHDLVLRVWNPITGELENMRHIGVQLNAVCWNPDGSQIAGATADNHVYIWDSLLGPPVNRLSGHATYVHTVSWNSDGKRIASADESGSIRIWDASTAQQTLALSYPSSVPMVAWNPDGKSLACVGFGGPASAQIWDAMAKRSGRVYWNKVSKSE